MIEGRRPKPDEGRDGSPSSEEAERVHDLARAFRGGDVEAFSALVDIFKERFYRIAYRILGNPDDALDTVQDAFVRIHHGIPGWDGRAAFYSWSFRIVTNLAIDALRRKGRDRKAREQAAGDRAVVHHDPEPQDVSAEDVSRLVERAREAIAKLPPGQRAIVALRHYENLSLKEIAEIRGCAVGTVKSTLHQAFNSLRRALGGDAASLAAVVRRDVFGGQQGVESGQQGVES